MDIAKLAEDALATALEKGWYEGKEPTVEQRLLLIHSEISEAAEEFRKNDDLAHIYFVTDKNGNEKPEGFLVELADAFIRSGDFLARKNLVEEFIAALNLKMEYNKTRPHRHGGKLF